MILKANYYHRASESETKLEQEHFLPFIPDIILYPI
jgi:hypothetical protein